MNWNMPIRTFQVHYCEPGPWVKCKRNLSNCQLSTVSMNDHIQSAKVKHDLGEKHLSGCPFHNSILQHVPEVTLNICGFLNGGHHTHDQGESLPNDPLSLGGRRPSTLLLALVPMCWLSSKVWPLEKTYSFSWTKIPLSQQQKKRATRAAAEEDSCQCSGLGGLKWITLC